MGFVALWWPLQYFLFADFEAYTVTVLLEGPVVSKF